MLLIYVGLDDFNRYGFDINLQVNNSGLEKTVCLAKMGVVFFVFDKHQIAEIPLAFDALIQRFADIGDKIAYSLERVVLERPMRTWN